MTSSLIARLERLTGPDREVDAEIWLAVNNGKWPQRFHTEYHQQPVWIDDPHQVPSYTASVNDAMTLLPKGYGAVSAAINEHGPSSMRIGHPYVFGNGATPAIALVIAALKAREAKP